MKVLTEILGNAYLDKGWESKLAKKEIEYIYLDHETSQKSKFSIKGDRGNEYIIALNKKTELLDGDIVSFDTIHSKAVILKLDISPVMIVDLSVLNDKNINDVIRVSVELGHALGSMHWPTLIKGTSVYIPHTLDQKTMISVLEKFDKEGITYRFQKGCEIISELEPHEIRHLFIGMRQELHTNETFFTQGYIPSHLPQAHKHDHLHEHDHSRDDRSHQHEHNYSHGHIHQHNYEHGHGHDHSHNHEHEHNRDHSHKHKHEQGVKHEHGHKTGHHHDHHSKHGH